MIRSLSLAALGAALLAAPLAAQQAISCILRPIHEIEVAPPVAGLLEEITVDRGDAVEKGQVLGRLQAHVEEARLAAARQRAESTAAVEAREAQVAEIERQLEQVRSLTERGVAAQNQLDEMLAEVSVARAQLAETQDARLAARLEADAAEAAVALRVIRAPVSGLVLIRHVDPGEYAAADEPLLDLVTVDTLLAEILLPAAAQGDVARGDTVTVTDETGTLVRAGRVDAVDPVIDAASRSFGLRVRLDNADGAFVAGSRCGASFD